MKKQHDTEIAIGLSRTHSSTARGEVFNLHLDTHNVKRDIGSLSIVALGFNICNSWVAIATSLAVALSAGGTVTLLYGILIVSVVYLSVAASLAEMASVYPTAGGQYHFTSILAPERFGPVLSYTCGMTGVFSWSVLCAAVNILVSQLLLILIQYYRPSYIATSYQYFLVSQAANLLFFLYNLFAIKRTPRVHDVGCKFSLPTVSV